MTVKELIKALLEMPPDLAVIIGEGIFPSDALTVEWQIGSFSAPDAVVIKET